MPSHQIQDNEVQRLHSAIAELTLLNELALAASMTTDVNQVLDTIVQKSIKAVRAEQGSIMRVTTQADAPLKTLIRKEDLSTEILGYRVGTHISGWVLKHKQPLIIEDLAKDERFNLGSTEINDIRTVLCVPILIRGQLIGVLTMVNKKTAEPFNQNDLRLLSIIAAQSGQLIHNSELQQESFEKKRLEHQLQLAREIQHDLVPKHDPHNKFLEIASFFRPADAVGGDYFDYFELADNKLGIVIADVSGHGPSAAMVMTLIKGILHSITHIFNSANKTLEQVNEIVSSIIPAEIFITMQLLVFDFSKNCMEISNAGHNPVLFFVNSKKACRLIDLHGCALNVLPRCKYTNEIYDLNSGDFILIYTDGINEAFNEKNDMYQIAGLAKSAEKYSQMPAKMMIDHIHQDIEAFVGDLQQADDMIMIAIKIL